MVRCWVVAIALALCLSGCASDNPSDDHDPPPKVETAGFADLKGIVVDAAVRPVANATVELVGAGNVTPSGATTTTTDAGGVFWFRQLEPGLATVRATAPGFLAVQASLILEVDKVAQTTLVLLADAAQTPYQTLHHWQGFIEASASIATFAVDLFAEAFLNQSLCRCTFYFNVDEQPAAYVYEVYLDENLPAGPAGESDYYWELIGSAQDSEIINGYAKIPIYQVIEGDAFPPDRMNITARVTGPAFWPSYQQDYDLFVSVFYREAPPTGWSAQTDG